MKIKMKEAKHLSNTSKLFKLLTYHFIIANLSNLNNITNDTVNTYKMFIEMNVSKATYIIYIYRISKKKTPFIK